jgi:hypothetical protein
MYRPWQDPDDPRCRHLIILPNVARLSQPGAIEACCSIDDEIRVVQDSNMTRRPLSRETLGRKNAARSRQRKDTAKAVDIGSRCRMRPRAYLLLYASEEPTGVCHGRSSEVFGVW